MVSNINSRAAVAGYTLNIENKKSPEAGLMITFKYPQDRCTITYKPIDSIQREKGLVFNIYNKSLVQNLKKQQMPVIRTASIEEPSVIIIDPGHGGSDTGAIAVSGISEKEVCLSVAQALNGFLTDRGYTVYLSREHDDDVPLDMRTRLASVHDATLVVSIHANAAPNAESSGLEIFFLDPLFVDNQVHMPSTLYATVKKKHTMRIAASKQLAEKMQHAFNRNLPKMHDTYHNRGIKSAVSQLLLGTFKPTVLIEIGFLTNPHEAKLLADHRYQRLIAYSIASGIDHYCRNI
jgi:N-acetylmuramoyl-L-alanine amidase